MELALSANTAQEFERLIEEMGDLEGAGLDAVWVAENSGFDAPSRLGYLAARSERVQIGTNVMAIFSRTPTLLAMTAAGVDALSHGRMNLGLGVGNAVQVENWHGTPFDGPLGRMREIVQICRQVWSGEPVAHDGKRYQLPLPAERGTGLGGPRALLETPVRERVPIWLASIGERSVAQTAEIADGWLPLFLIPEKVDAAWGEALAAGRAKRDAGLGQLRIAAGGPVAIGEGAEVRRLRDLQRPVIAFFLGGLGAKGNHYNRLAQRYGYGAEARLVEDLYHDGKAAAAAAAVPAELLELTSLIGPRSWVAERIAAYREAGVTQLQVAPVTAAAAAAGGIGWNAEPSPAELISELRDLL
jgi:F420-dependent oxidoreductase-like protein